VKKVRKFVEFGVNPNTDKKQLKADMESAFQLLKDCYMHKTGHERFYVQLPTTAAHEFHIDTASALVEDTFDATTVAAAAASKRLHPKVAQKIRDLVSSGELQLYSIRHQLRRYVEKELFDGSNGLPEKHDLTYYPTIHDLQNHIHQAIKDIETGILPYTPASVKMENMEQLTSSPSRQVNANDDTTVMEDSGIGLIDGQQLDPVQAQTGAVVVPDEVPRQLLATEAGSSGTSMATTVDLASSRVETVTLMLTSAPDEDGHHTVARVELRLCNGTTHVSSVVPPEVAHIISSVSPDLVSHPTLDSISFALQRNKDQLALPLSPHIDGSCVGADEPTDPDASKMVVASVPSPQEMASMMHHYAFTNAADLEAPLKALPQPVPLDSSSCCGTESSLKNAECQLTEIETGGISGGSEDDGADCWESSSSGTMTTGAGQEVDSDGGGLCVDGILTMHVDTPHLDEVVVATRTSRRQKKRRAGVVAIGNDDDNECQLSRRRVKWTKLHC
jgi:hypothetical protein